MGAVPPIGTSHGGIFFVPASTEVVVPAAPAPASPTCTGGSAARAGAVKRPAAARSARSSAFDGGTVVRATGRGFLMVSPPADGSTSPHADGRPFHEKRRR